MTTEYVNSAVDLSAEYVNVSDITDRAEELESAALDLLNGEDGELSELDTDTTAEQLVAAGMDADDAAEMVMLRDILEDLRGGGGDDPGDVVATESQPLLTNGLVVAGVGWPVGHLGTKDLFEPRATPGAEAAIGAGIANVVEVDAIHVVLRGNLDHGVNLELLVVGM